MALHIVQGRSKKLRHIVASIDTRGAIFTKMLLDRIARAYALLWSGLLNVPFFSRQKR